MFKDIAGHWAENVIKRMVKRNMIAGYEDGTFRPDRNITRAETAAMIDRYYTTKWATVKELTPKVVTITAEKFNGQALGSGVVLDKEGHIATNVHVILNGIDASSDIKVYFDRATDLGFKARVQYGDFGQDIAILKVDGVPPEWLSPAKFAQEVKWLEDVICIGSPLGQRNTATMGIVSFEQRVFSGMSWIQTDAAINPGNSGGGAFNLYRELIGLPTFKIIWADETKTIPIDNMGFITPFYEIEKAYKHVINRQLTGLHGEPVEFILEQ